MTDAFLTVEPMPVVLFQWSREGRACRGISPRTRKTLQITLRRRSAITLEGIHAIPDVIIDGCSSWEPRIIRTPLLSTIITTDSRPMFPVSATISRQPSVTGTASAVTGIPYEITFGVRSRTDGHQGCNKTIIVKIRAPPLMNPTSEGKIGLTVGRARRLWTRDRRRR